MNPSLTGEVKTVEAEAQYGGRIYDRTISIQTSSGVIDCFQGREHVTEEDRGKEVDIVLLTVQPDYYTTQDTGVLGIEQPNNTGEDQSKWATTIFGEVVSTDVDDQWTGKNKDDLILLDVGAGTLIMELNESEETPEIGTIVQVDCSRLDIVGRNTDTDQ